MKSSKQFIFFALAASGQGISGGDRIFIELARRWSKKYPITIYLWEEGYQMCMKQKLQMSNVKFQISTISPWRRFGFFVNYVARIFEGIRIASSIQLNNSSSTIVYSASEFWMDSVPAYILKMRFKNITWVAAWFQTAPNPLKGFSTGERENSYKVSAFFYWLVQLPIKPIISHYADYVLINNESEKDQFPRLSQQKKAIVLIGAVDLNHIDLFKKKHREMKKLYDAVFQGRFHPQKGVVELVEIWKKVVEKKSDAKLMMIGDGPLMGDVRKEIKNLKLEKNVILLGYVFDGEEKYKTFVQSNIVLHPAFYDSGGMASAEAMAFGLPCIGFNLKSYESYYPKGMLKARVGDMDDFASITLKLLRDDKLRRKIGEEAMNEIYKKYSWDTRADQILQILI